MNVEQSLRALAADDAMAQVPPSVDAAVMAAWDASCGAGHGQSARRSHVIVYAALGGALAASIVGLAVVAKSRPKDEVRHVLQQSVPEKALTARMPDTVATVIAPVDGVPRSRVSKAARRASMAAPQMDAEYVLVPDADIDGPLTMMRVRMSRSEFSRIGVPIANPDGDGLVDVEMLVGEDGVARSIRRATAVGWTDPNR